MLQWAEEGLVEAVAVTLATVVFGLGWAVFEIERGSFVQSGYDAPDRLALPFLAPIAPEAPVAANAKGNFGRFVEDGIWTSPATTAQKAPRATPAAQATIDSVPGVARGSLKP